MRRYNDALDAVSIIEDEANRHLQWAEGNDWNGSRASTPHGMLAEVVISVNRLTMMLAALERLRQESV